MITTYIMDVVNRCRESADNTFTVIKLETFMSKSLRRS